MRRGSHVHHTPHVGLAQIDPATRVRPVTSTPISAEATAIASKAGLLVQSHPTLARNTTMNARNAVHAEGTWTYMTRCTCPCTASGGAHTSAIAVAMIAAPMLT